MRSLTPELGYRFASLVDGEGHFAINRNKSRTGNTWNGGYNYACSFVVKLRADDKPFLEIFHEAVGLGHIYDIAAPTASYRNTKPAACWQINTIVENRELVEIFDVYPLWSKKANDYAIWREAVLMRASGGVRTSDLERLWDELRAVRAYADDGRAISNPVFGL